MGGEPPVTTEAKLTVSQAEFARLRGVSRKTVTLWKGQGRLVLTADGLVDVAASDAMLAQRPPVYRGGKKKPRKDEPATAPDAPPVMDRPPEEIAKIAGWSLPEAQRVKENYLALLREQEFNIAQGNLVLIDDVVTEVTRQFGIVRERLLNLPGKLAPLLASADSERAKVEAAIREELYEALSQLSEQEVLDKVANDGAHG
jgi:hypothetical protein